MRSRRHPKTKDRCISTLETRLVLAAIARGLAFLHNGKDRLAGLGVEKEDRAFLSTDQELGFVEQVVVNDLIFSDYGQIRHALVDVFGGGGWSKR